jgi:hypothetical protein
MKITINPLDSKSIDAAIKMLNKYEKELAVKEEEFVRRLKELGVSVATDKFATANYDGVNDVLVTSVQNKNRSAVIAYGETVGFIEFGTGVKNPDWVDTNNQSGTPYTPPAHGTYGKGLGNNPHGWYFRQSEGAKARHTYGNQPAEAMLTARDVMVENVIRIAREVWND